MSRPLLGALAVVAVVIGWPVLAPISLGGGASYVAVRGTSMLPHFRTGALVVTRRRGSYHVGEVVAYHNRQLGVVVMHRIVARTGERYVFKGDNNSYPDSYHPRTRDLIGAESVYVPGAGSVLTLLHSPLIFGLFIGLIGFLASTAYMPKVSRRMRRHAHR